MSLTKSLFSGSLQELVILNLLIAIVPPCLSAPLLPTPEALGRAYGLYGYDKDNLLKRITKMAKHLVEWDPTYTLENAAGLAASCDMINHDVYSWQWDALKKPGPAGQLKHYTRGRGASGIFGFVKSSTLLTPWREWQDLNLIIQQWEYAPEYSGEHRAISSTEKIGCAVMPGCISNKEYYTGLVCLLSPKINMVPASDEVELDHQPPMGFSGPIPGESPLTPLKGQDDLPIESALVQPQEKQKTNEIVPLGPEDVNIEKQDYLPEKLYGTKINPQYEEKADALDYPNSKELELEIQPGAGPNWKRI